MKTFTVSAMLWALGLCLAGTLVAADKQQRLDEFDKRIDQINAMANKPANLNVALQRISTETGVPMESVKQQHKRHPEIGAGGLMVANILANETKKKTETFLSEKAGGKSWVEIARENKVPVDKLNDRLERLEKAMKG